MKSLFKTKISRFGSLLSLVTLTAMLMLFALALPEFLTSAAGRIFAGIWALLSIIVCLAHSTRLSGERRQRFYFPGFDERKSRDGKRNRMARAIRG
ncbi:MAG TPA: hypothetical protein DCP36_10850 [Sporomusaceae bacterium]|jgi:hypothetical protein|uniref:hypothetical protein n=1 Tax=Anaerospora sp. TaxID=1960278 RepID=UPI000EBA4175|nr:hypothetical protein [Anaerospora sp.]MDF2929126.1 hypothetical protein [Anaerospora sp.]HAK73949.1 hypothetical protein [Sporomusaceae bacterium]